MTDFDQYGTPSEKFDSILVKITEDYGLETVEVNLLKVSYIVAEPTAELISLVDLSYEKKDDGF